MSLKIIGGDYRGRVLRAVRGLGTRPLLGQVREALFNIFQDVVPGAVVWDLFAGTGASGIEALSRGAGRVLFCEKNGRALDVLRGNLQMLGGDAVARSVVVRGDAWDPPRITADAFGRGGVVAAARDGADRGERDRDDRNGRDDDERDERDDREQREQRSDHGDRGERGDDAQRAGDELAPDLIFLDPPYSLVAEDPVKSLARARRLMDRTAPGGCVVFHFEAGVLDEDDFDDDLDVDLRTWGTTAIAMTWRRGEAPERLRRRWQKDRERDGDGDGDRD